MARTTIPSVQVRDDNILIQDLADFAVIKRATGLTIDIQAGRIRNDNTITDKTAATLTVSNNTTTFVELDTTGVVQSNNSAFTTGFIALATVVSSGGNVTTVTDKRTWINILQPQDATLTAIAGLTITANSLIYGTGTDAFAVLAQNATATRKFLRQVSSTAPAWDTLAQADISGLTTSDSPSFAGLTLTGDLTLSTHNIITDTTTGTKIGTATTQKLGFFNSTPIVKPSGNALTALSNLGLVASPTLLSSDVSLGNVTNDAQIKASDFPSSSVDSEVVLFSGTSGKVVKRASASGVALVTSGVLSVVTIPSDATKFLNGSATPAYAQVKDSDLSLSDITTNDVSITKHGFAPKAPNDSTKFLNGIGTYTIPASSGISTVGDVTSGTVAFNGTAGTTLTSTSSGFTLLAASTSSGTGGPVSLTGGLTTNAGSTGGSATLKGGAGNTSGPGGDASVLGGTPGTTGVGGNVVLTAANGGSTSGNGGSVLLTGGNGTASNSTGGLVTANGGNGKGTNAGGALSFYAGNGGSDSTGGVGGNATFSAGDGKGTNANGGLTYIYGGAGIGTQQGGDVTVQSGRGGATGASGAVNLTGATGGSTSGAGGGIFVTSGSGAAGNSAGGVITIVSGNGIGTGKAGVISITQGQGGTTSSAPSTLTITGGAAGTGADTAGGDLTIISGAGNLTGAGGASRLTAGIGGATGNGGSVTILGGSGGGTSGTGGNVTVQGGPANDGIGGGVFITGANGAGTNRAGGVVSITTGNGIGTASGGNLTLSVGTSGASASSSAGTISITSGAGNNGQSGGDITITGGAGQGAGTGAGITITSGASGASNAASGGVLNINAGAGNASGNTSGGNLNLTGGAGGGTGTGGQATVTGGRGGATGNGNDVTISGGAGGSTSGSAGGVTIQSGTVTSGETGNITIKTRNAAGTNNRAGSINFTLGTPTGSATTPNMKLTQPNDNATAFIIKIDVAQASITASDTFIDFWPTSEVSIGSIAGTAVSGVIAYNTFTGSHYTEVQSSDRQELIPAILLEATDNTVSFNLDQCFTSRICRTRGSKSAIGAWGGLDKHNHDFVLSIGTGILILANKGVNLEIGDYLISSDVAGRVEKQDDDIYRNITIAKITENVVWNENETEREVRVIYLGG